MKKLLLLALLVLLGCAPDDPFPNRCRAIGVFVENDDVITGTIAESIEVRTVNEVRSQCQRPFGEDRYGCTIGLGFNEYRIVYKGWDARIHEECHALYEEWRHFDG